MFKNIKRVMFWFIIVGLCFGVVLVMIPIIKGSSYISQHGLKSVVKPTIERVWNGSSTHVPEIGDTKDACIEVIFTKDGWIPVEGK
jgi:hypothetical protein